MITIILIMFFAGVMLAGSDGPYFPLPNFAGIALISISALLAIRKQRG